MTMVAGSSFNRIGAAATLVALGLLFATATVAQIQHDVDQCLGKVGVTPDQQAVGCTAVIDSKTYVGKELAFAFNNRGLVSYSKRDFDRAIADYTEAVRLDPGFARGYGNRALAYKA